MQIESATKQINQLGKEKTPFFLLTDFELKEIVVCPLAELDENILFDLNGVTNFDSRIADSKIDFPHFNIRPYPFDKYYKEFDQVMDNILFGNTYLINLTAKHELLECPKLIDVFHNAKAKYRLYYKGQAVVFSPETFVTIKDGLIHSYPMKGTIDASVPEAEKTLLENEKELAEHYTIVDLIRNDLSINAEEVAVTKFRYLDHIKSNQKDLLQVSSEIQGRLGPNYNENLGDILFSMLPAGSISGAPKKKTVEIIQKTEPHKRGYYTGVCGMYDGQNFDSFVMIRYLEKEGNKVYYRSGGGITCNSEVEKEYMEMVDKIYIPNA